jgi:hypothetical protein
MIANLRCNEIKQQSLDLVSEDLKLLSESVKNGKNPDFGVESQKIMGKAIRNLFFS